MEDNAFDKIKSMFNDSNFSNEFQSIISNIGSSDNKNSQEQDQNSSNSGFNIDFETILKFKNIMDKMNFKDDPRARLLSSLKPYLRDNRRNKIDTYIQFLNMSKMLEIFSDFKR